MRIAHDRMAEVLSLCPELQMCEVSGVFIQKGCDTPGTGVKNEIKAFRRTLPPIQTKEAKENGSKREDQNQDQGL